jgi:hypothetical protein
MEWINAHYKILADKDVDKETKLFAILFLLHDDHISLHKAHELCTEYGLFSDHWMTLDAWMAENFHNYYSESNNEKVNT